MTQEIMNIKEEVRKIIRDEITKEVQRESYQKGFNDCAENRLLKEKLKQYEMTVNKTKQEFLNSLIIIEHEDHLGKFCHGFRTAMEIFDKNFMEDNG